MRTINAITIFSIFIVGLTLSAQEPQRPTGSWLADRFEQLDRDGDGKLTRDETPQTMPFDQWDANKDGVATLDEVRAFYSGQRLLPSPSSAARPPAKAVSMDGVTWTDVYPIGTKDANGQTLYGIQMMFLVPHKGRLYAANGTQGETQTDKYPNAAQVLVLDSPSGQWRVDKQSTTDNPRVNDLKREWNARRRYIFKNDPANVTRTLLAVRDFAVSPFPEDESQVLYACGLDHQGQPMSLAAWIYRGDLRLARPKELKR